MTDAVVEKTVHVREHDRRPPARSDLVGDFAASEHRIDILTGPPGFTLVRAQVPTRSVAALVDAFAASVRALAH